MKALLFSLTLLISSNLFAADCYELEKDSTILRNLSMPVTFCLDNIEIKNSRITGLMIVDGEERRFNTSLKTVDFETSRAGILIDTYDGGSCDVMEGIVMTVEVSRDHIDGRFLSVESILGEVSATSDSCHHSLKKEKLNYKFI